MNKFEKRREEIRKKLEAELKRIDEEESLQRRKVVAPLASRLSALMAEEVERLGKEDFEAIEGFRFRKTEAREAIRKFLAEMLGASSGKSEG
ncbi:MAG: hypothetical protein D6812_00850 [Deltaproteobacteria bacterium]|nr:MAG: hypothetical protein D6812_00850 [Deltaproteobacteria bacterium]